MLFAANGLAAVFKGLADLLCKVPANVLAGFASFLGGAASGGAVALGVGQLVGPSAVAAASSGGKLGHRDCNQYKQYPSLSPQDICLLQPVRQHQLVARVLTPLPLEMAPRHLP